MRRRIRRTHELVSEFLLLGFVYALLCAGFGRNTKRIKEMKMEKEKYFVIWYELDYKNEMAKIWKLSELFENYEDAKKIYDEFDGRHGSKVCKTIYG